MSLGRMITFHQSKPLQIGLRSGMFSAALIALIGCSNAAEDMRTDSPEQLPASNAEPLAQPPAVTGTDVPATPPKLEPDTTARSAESHQHGGAELTLVLEGNLVTAEFETPLYNLLGFEHAPKTAAQREAVDAAKEALSKGERMLSIGSDAGCVAETDLSGLEIFPESVSDDKSDHDHDHAAAENDDGHDRGHRDLRVTYKFECASPAALDRVDIGLFDAFPLMETLEVVYLGPDAQRQYTLDRRKTALTLGR
jgi:hypothetical protein